MIYNEYRQTQYTSWVAWIDSQDRCKIIDNTQAFIDDANYFINSLQIHYLIDS